MNPITIITKLGPLLTGESRGLSVVSRFGGPWYAAWACNERGDDFAWCASVDPVKALAGLADRLVTRARARVEQLSLGDEDDRELAEAIRLVLVEIDGGCDASL